MNRYTMFLICMFAFTCLAADKPKSPVLIAIHDFTSDTSLSNAAVQATSLISAVIAADTNITLLDQVRLKSAVASLSSNSVNVSQEMASKIAQNMGAKVLISGQLISSGTDRVIIMANVVLSATGQSFPAQVDGPSAKIVDLSSALSDKISHIINDQAPVLARGAEAPQDKLTRVIQSISFTNKPSISFTVYFPAGVDRNGNRRQCAPVEIELGRIFLLAGFNVLEGSFKKDSDYELIGVSAASPGPKKGDFFSSVASLEGKVTDRKTGKVLAAERSGWTSLNLGKEAAERIARSNSAGELSQKILPVLATAIKSGSAVP